MEIAKEIKDFLTTRRARITPDQVGLPTGGRRRVAGLRREEVAMLAGVSAEYYVQIERGGVSGVSDEVLHAIATALRLDDEETKHLFTLARAASTRPRRRNAPRARVEVPEPVQALVDAMITAPAVVQNGHLDIVAVNALGRALYADVFDRSDGVPNLARFIFLDRRSGETFPDWNHAADDAVAILRSEAARSPYCGHRPRRRVGHSQRRVPHSLGDARHQGAPARHQAVPSSRRRGPDSAFRGARGCQCGRSHPVRIHRRAWFSLRGIPPPALQLGRIRPARTSAFLKSGKESRLPSTWLTPVGSRTSLGVGGTGVILPPVSAGYALAVTEAQQAQWSW